MQTPDTAPNNDPPLLDEPGEIYATIRDHLASYLVGQDAAVRRLALIGVAHLVAPLTAPGAVRWLIGPSGSGKTTLLQALADCLGLPLIRLDATRLTAAGWMGVDPDSVVSNALANVPPDSRGWHRPLLVLDDAQHLRIKTVVDGSDRSHQMNRQSSLLTFLCGAARIWVTEGKSAGHAWRATGALRIVAGAFDLTPEQSADPAALHDAGFIPEFSNRLAQPAVHLTLLTGDALGMALRPGHYYGPLADLHSALGGAGIVVQPGAIDAIVLRAKSQAGATPRTVKLALDAAIEHRILALLEAGELSPDRAPEALVLTAAHVEAS